jgi:hypothetical protein
MPDKKKRKRKKGKDVKVVEDEQDSDEEFVKKSTITEYSNEWFEFDTAVTTVIPPTAKIYLPTPVQLQ